eukprot:scaffold113348_cov60-Phaeocystis_antarctica.AAC.1
MEWMDGWMDGWIGREHSTRASERRASEKGHRSGRPVCDHMFWHASLPPRTCSDHTISMTRWLPRTQVRGLEKLGANAKIDRRPCLGAAVRDDARYVMRGAAVCGCVGRMGLGRGNAGRGCREGRRQRTVQGVVS